MNSCSKIIRSALNSGQEAFPVTLDTRNMSLIW